MISIFEDCKVFDEKFQVIGYKFKSNEINVFRYGADALIVFKNDKGTFTIRIENKVHYTEVKKYSFRDGDDFIDGTLSLLPPNIVSMIRDNILSILHIIESENLDYIYTHKLLSEKNINEKTLDSFETEYHKNKQMLTVCWKKGL
jgi:hypothetical protein